ncbi:hypothetical protein GCM10022224_063510 [Nonomuraea antimicrobica]|uniref:Core-binding (CB) domain-containing protein n=1 Tax=Nonomuraea antimicrobica TaxID=561173 RepID=A0ABP7CIV2_9ACTN
MRCAYSGYGCPDRWSSRGTVLGLDQLPLEPLEHWLAYLTSAGRSPNTIKSYAHDLKDWFSFLADRGIDW